MLEIILLLTVAVLLFVLLVRFLWIVPNALQDLVNEIKKFHEDR